MRVTQVTGVKDEAHLRRRAPVLWPWALVVAAWMIAGLAVLTNQSYLINHHYLLEESHLPVLVALVVFLACWQVMTVGMMLPSSMPMVYMIVHAGRQQRRPHAVPGAFLAGYALVWTAFASVTFLGDTQIHWLVHHWFWLDTHTWVIGATTFALAGVFQFSPLKGRCLKQCRSPFSFFMRYYRLGVGAAWRLGLRHGMFCLGCCWAFLPSGWPIRPGSWVALGSKHIARSEPLRLKTIRDELYVGLDCQGSHLYSKPLRSWNGRSLRPSPPTLYMQGRRKRGETRLPGGAFYEGIDAMGGPRRSKGESIEALEEAVQIIHAFWSSNRSPRFEGKYHTVKGSRPGPYPAHPIGLWLGFYGPRSLALTGQLADGWLPSSSYAPPERLPQMQQRISDAALSAGRQPQDIRRIYNIMGLITTTPVQDLLVGPADHWVEELIRLVVEIGIDTFIYWPATDPVGQIGLFAAEIVPAVQKQVAGVRDTS